MNLGVVSSFAREDFSTFKASISSGASPFKSSSSPAAAVKPFSVKSASKFSELGLFFRLRASEMARVRSCSESSSPSALY